ncbi:hypothetical protein CF166_13175 [Amycolatopsis sp. KNN50.9b]|nr:hypothetical protein CF166_13175 [Amycolatopsis sp. KNN50.9b]
MFFSYFRVHPTTTLCRTAGARVMYVRSATAVEVHPCLEPAEVRSPVGVEVTSSPSSSTGSVTRPGRVCSSG